MDMESSLPERDDENGRLCWLPDSDPAFRLFGKLIALPMTAENAACESGIAQIQQEEENSLSDDDRLSLRGVDKLGVSSGSNSGSDEEAIPRPRNEGAKDEFKKPGDPNAEARNCEQGLEETKVKISSAAANQDKALLKPDKPVPCPRCESMDTKFCYFNNYNLSQPRHFCRSCQRYWTAGGTLRNVPVGAGRRKTKHSSSQQKQSSLASSSIVSREDDPNGAQPLLNCSLPQVAGFKSGPGRTHPPLESHIPSVEPRYCPDSSSSSSSLSSSLTSLTADMPYHGDLPPSFKSMLGVRIPEVRVPQMQDDPGSSSSHTKIKIDAETANEPKMALPNGVSDSSEGSNTTEANREWKHNPGRYSSTADLTPTADLAPGSDSSIDGERVAKADSTCVEAEFWLNGLVSPCFGGVWPYMFSMGWPGAGQPPINAAPLAGASNGLWQWPPFSGPVWGPQGLSFPWSLPWSAAAAAAVAANANAVIAGGTLGKRSRRVSEGMSDGSLCIPKTLRIHDPEEAARSSILKTLGVCNKTESLSSGGFFNAFQPKAEVFQPKPGMKNSEGSLLAKHANPAAMARSMTFQGNM